VEDPRRNVELKATDPDPDRSLAVCRELGAGDEGELWQRDTYFAVAHGGLKLREQEPGTPHLIQFARADRPEQRESRYRIAGVADGATTRAALEAALGVTCVVEKRRRLFLWNDVRIHLDRVEGLGTFVELEAVAPSESDLSVEHERVAFLREALAISDERLVAVGYAALLAEGLSR
jgi:adenylate cyclase class 2